MAERTVILDGFSKTYCMTGWRLGYAVAPRSLARNFEKLMTNSNSCAANFVQHAGLAALQGDPRGVEAMVETFRARRDALVDGLSTLPGIACDRPEGAYFAFADVRGTGLSSRVLADRFLEEGGVACVEGTAFGPAGEGFLRFSFVDDVARIREATSRMRNLLGG
jgi:aspartate/methionine/tyrosine aminotransferase